MTDSITGQAIEPAAKSTGAQRVGAPSPGVHRRGAWWLPVCFLALFFIAEYQLRRRSQEETVSGAVDLQVITEVAVYALVGAYLISRLRLTNIGRPRLPAVAMWSFLGAMTLAAMHSPFPRLALARAGQLFVAGLLAVAIDRGARRADFHRLAHAYVGILLVSVAFGAAVRLPRVPGQEDRFNWLYLHPVQVGIFLSIGVVIVAAYLFDNQLKAMAPLRSWVYAAAMTMLGLALIATRTRGAIGAAVAGVAVVGVASRPLRRRVDAVALGLLATTTVLLLVGSAVGEFLARGQEATQLTTLNSRTLVWEMAWDLVRDQPFTGLGLTASRGAFLEAFQLGGAHNSFFEVLVDAGFIGAAAWVFLVGAVTVSSWRLATTGRGRRPRHPDGIMWLGLCVVIVMNSFTDSGLGQAATTMSLWLFAAVGWILMARRQFEVARRRHLR